MRGKRYGYFLLLALCISTVPMVAYIVTHPFPALLGGLYLEMASTVANSGELVPPTVHGFTTEGLPFAYPPLGFYVIAVFLKLGLDGVQVLRFGAPLIMLCNVALLYHFTVVLTDSVETGFVAAVVAGTHISLTVYLVGASGFVRGLGFLFMLLALLGAYRWFADDGGWPALATALVGWGLVLQTHPVHAAAAGAGVFAAWLIWDRSPAGLAAGAGIAVGGLVLASPWWLTVVGTHGPGIFLNGAGSHGSINNGLSDFRGLASWFWGASYTLDVPAVFTLVGGAVLVTRGNWQQPAWLAAPVALLVPPHGRLGLLLVAPLGAVGMVYTARTLSEADIDLPEVSTARVVRGIDFPDVDRQTVVVVLCLLVLMGPFAAENVDIATESKSYSALPTYVDDEDRTAMAWVENETAADAQMTVIGGASEWFPYLTNRTSVVVKYGTEWQGEETWDRHQSAQSELAECWNASCVDTVLREYEFAAETDYVYVPYGGFVSGRGGASISPALHQSMLSNDRFERVYRNPGVGIYAYNDTTDTERRLGATDDEVDPGRLARSLTAGDASADGDIHRSRHLSAPSLTRAPGE